MSIAFAALLGAAFGAYRAHRRKGSKADMAQWAVVYAVIFALAALFVSIFIVRGAG